MFTNAPPLQQVLQTVALDAASWRLIAALALARFPAVDVQIWLPRGRGVRSV